MPYADPIKKKAYYERHQKHYQKTFIAANRDQWNEYQKNYKVNKRIEIVEKIKTDLREINVAEEDGLTFKAAVILCTVLQTGILKERALAYRTNYTYQDVKTIFSNWAKNGIYKDGKIIIEEWQTDLEFISQVTLIAMVGSGEVVRCVPDKPQDEFNIDEIFAMQKEREQKPYEFMKHKD